MDENILSPSQPEKSSKTPAPALSVPQLTLPKGGGAIRGIDEKFRANPLTGTGSLTVPISLSPGRSGFGPQLSLAYDSGLGNGPFGMGWSLALPAITRKTDKGIPQYRDSVESDIFILSGSEDLVPVLKRTEGGDWTLDEFERDGYWVKLYRPRIEGLFARIERWTRREDGDTHWRSLSKDNILTIYGFDHESRIADPVNPAHVFSWLICQSYDAKGNSIIYNYVPENAEDVHLSKANERNRLRTANRYVKRIRYGNRRPLLLDVNVPGFRPSHLCCPDFDAADWMFEAVFDYGAGHYRESPPDVEGRIFVQASAPPLPDCPWPVRKDPFSNYRSGFEVRTYRLCRRVLMFHHFPAELGCEDYLVRSTEFKYHEKPVGSFIRQVTQSGYKRQADGSYLRRSLPALDLSYTESPLEKEEPSVFPIKDADSRGLPEGIDGANYRWLDLDGEGIAGVLSEQGTGWFYKPNLGNGRFGATELVARKPSLAAIRTGQQLMDVGGDGNLDLVDFRPGTAGFFERTLTKEWGRFRPFHSLPVLDWNDPNLKFIDVTGDGIADILITEDVAFRWYPSLLEEGFGPAVRIPAPQDEEKGPRVIFADRTQSIFLADMTGDGLTDIVRIRNGNVCYWPNLGYGHFGPKICMDHSPWFGEVDQFDPRRIRLADMDGSGTTDILYLGRDGIHVYLNEAGNGWSGRRVLKDIPTGDHRFISVADFLGRGTACIVWSSSLPGDAGRPLRYLDLMDGKKPHLLTRVRNNLGAETAIEYASSTEVYLADKEAGTPWVTRLAFPVHVVKRIETYDYVGRNRFVTRYSYHHGYYDSVEREFRGFGRVDQLDTEEFASVNESESFPAGDNLDAASNVPPVLTKTWFHTGVYRGGAGISRHMEHEYYHEGDPRRGETALDPERVHAMQLADTILPEGLSPQAAREACRSLKGAMLRQEIYACDGTEKSARAYTVSENNYTIRLLQPQRDNRYAVFFTHAREMVGFHYERTLYSVEGCMRADPRASHNVTLEVDDFGNLLKAVDIAYGRRFPDRSELLTDADRAEQQRLHLTLTENRYTNAVQQGNAYRTPQLCETKIYELLHVEVEAGHPGITNLFRFRELANQVAQASDGRHDLPYEDLHAADARRHEPYRRLIHRTRILFRSDRLDRLLSLGGLEALALPGESYKLAFTPGLLKQVYQQAGQPLLPNPADVLGGAGADRGGYVDLDGDGHFWIPSGRMFLSPNSHDTPAQELAYAGKHFFLTDRYRDPFYTEAVSTESFVTFDNHDLLILETTDPLGNRVTAGERLPSGERDPSRPGNDYRLLQPGLVMDPNRNRSTATFDALGMVVGTAAMGKPEENLGDTLADFEPDLSDTIILDHLAHPLEDPLAILGRASTRLVYDLFAFQRTNSQPAVVYTLARETHDADLQSGRQTSVQHRFTYSDGFGREVQKKVQAEPGPVPLRDAAGKIRVAPDGQPPMTKAKVKPRWVGSGWTVFNNKGKPVRQYEPFFTDTHYFEFDVRIGVSPILIYDPVQRVVVTLHSNHTWEKVLFDPWQQEIWDVNDTVLIADPAADADVGLYFSRLPAADYQPTWYAQRQDGSLGRQEQEAARKTAVHAATPAVTYADSLGRTLLGIAHNKFRYSNSPPNAPPSEEHYRTRNVLDIKSNQRELIDARNRVVMRYDYDMLGNRIHQASMEAGERWTLNDAAAKPLYGWDSRDHQFRTTYDPLRRPVNAFLSERGAAELLVERTIYGESKPSPEAMNLRSKIVQVFDQAGVVTNDSYDFKGNLVRSRRQLARNYKTTLNWSDSPSLEVETFTGATQYDALNRPIQLIPPHSDQPGAQINVIEPIYNEAGLLEATHAWLNQTAEPAILLDSITADVHAITNIDYNAKGQRELIEYGNGARTTYRYDSLTFRLTTLRTTRRCDPALLQDLNYTYDPQGNITHIHDDAQQTIYFRNKRVEPSNDYIYDATYRLIEAKGREYLEQAGGPPIAYSYNDAPRVGVDWNANDGNAMGRYDERYKYDFVGNLLEMRHRGTDPVNPGWTRSFTYDEPSLLEPIQSNNRLSSTRLGNSSIRTEQYAYDAHGNQLEMPHLQAMQWDFKDQLQMTQRQAVRSPDTKGTDGQGERTYYVYDFNGKRLRKVTELPNGQIKDERIYVGSFETYRSNGINAHTVETLHLMDGSRRIALVETRTEGRAPKTPKCLVRYQFANQVDSAILELDDEAQIISYEEYSPYGSTTYQAVRSQTETPKRYRYTGKERDEESGLYYHGARYYAPWLARWTRCDPASLVDGPNLYTYTNGDPLSHYDPTGAQDRPNELSPGIGLTFDSRGVTFGPIGGSPDVDKANRGTSSFQLFPTKRPQDPTLRLVIEPSSPGTVDPTKKGDSTPAEKTSPDSDAAASSGSVAGQIPWTAERSIWALPWNKRGDIFDWMAGNNLGHNEPNADRITPNSVDQIKSTVDYDNVGNIARSATRDAAQYIADNPGTAAGRSPRAVMVVPTDAPASVSTDIATSLNPGKGRKIPAGALPPEEIRGLPGGWGIAGRALSAAGVGLSGYALYGDIQRGDASMAGGDALTLAGSGLELGGLTRVLGPWALRAGGGAAGVGIAITSGIRAYREYQQGDKTAAAFDAGAAVGGALITAAAIVSAPALAAGLAIGGIALVLGATAFHLGRWANWW